MRIVRVGDSIGTRVRVSVLPNKKYCDRIFSESIRNPK